MGAGGIAGGHIVGGSGAAGKAVGGERITREHGGTEHASGGRVTNDAIGSKGADSKGVGSGGVAGASTRGERASSGRVDSSAIEALCMGILRRYELPDGVIDHSVKVAEVASFIARRLIERGEGVNLEHVVAGALLHDVGKSARHVRRGARNHAEASAEIVRAEDLPELAGIVARHILDSIISVEDYPRNWEEKVVFYADKIVTRRLVTVEERFSDLHERRADITDLLTASLPPTKALEAEILAAAGLTWEGLAAHFAGKWVGGRW
ncbi:MAG: HDIG domain-containing protein [Bacillota bacterium]|nr:HDIG domain-containing protein [Bacillota bacterium]